MKRLGFAIFAVVLGITVFTACKKKEAVTPVTETAPAAVEQQAPATEAAPATAPATEAAPVPAPPAGK